MLSSLLTAMRWEIFKYNKRVLLENKSKVQMGLGPAPVALKRFSDKGNRMVMSNSNLSNALRVILQGCLLHRFIILLKLN